MENENVIGKVCFAIGEDIDLCTDCAAFLQEHGEPVESLSAENRR